VKPLAQLVGGHFRVHLFVGPHHTKLPRSLVVGLHEFGARAKYVELDSPGPNALDFHMADYLGGLAAADPDGYVHIISKDTGFDPLARHLMAKKILVARSESIEAMPCFQAQEAASVAAPEIARASGVDALVKMVVEDLVKRKASKPRKMATLRSTVKARIGAEKEGSLDIGAAALITHDCDFSEVQGLPIMTGEGLPRA
jgi:hypothetical protein